MSKEGRENFDQVLEEMLDEMSGAQLLAIPGLYEVVSEELNNAVIQRMEEAAREEASDVGEEAAEP